MSFRESVLSCKLTKTKKYDLLTTSIETKSYCDKIVEFNSASGSIQWILYPHKHTFLKDFDGKFSEIGHISIKKCFTN